MIIIYSVNYHAPNWIESNCNFPSNVGPPSTYYSTVMNNFIVKSRLIPANSLHHDGRKHVSTVPVKLTKPQNDARKSHPDRYFARSIVHQVEEFAGLFAPSSVFMLSQDDKARVPIGLPVAKKETALLMHVDYRVRSSTIPKASGLKSNRAFEATGNNFNSETFYIAYIRIMNCICVTHTI